MGQDDVGMADEVGVRKIPKDEAEDDGIHRNTKILIGAVLTLDAFGLWKVLELLSAVV